MSRNFIVLFIPVFICCGQDGGDGSSQVEAPTPPPPPPPLSQECEILRAELQNLAATHKQTSGEVRRFMKNPGQGGGLFGMAIQSALLENQVNEYNKTADGWVERLDQTSDRCKEKMRTDIASLHQSGMADPSFTLAFLVGQYRKRQADERQRRELAALVELEVQSVRVRKSWSRADRINYKIRLTNKSDERLLGLMGTVECTNTLEKKEGTSRLEHAELDIPSGAEKVVKGTSNAIGAWPGRPTCKVVKLSPEKIRLSKRGLLSAPEAPR